MLRPLKRVIREVTRRVAVAAHLEVKVCDTYLLYDDLFSDFDHFKRLSTTSGTSYTER